MNIAIEIKYRNGNVEQCIVDSYLLNNGCLVLYTRFGQNAGKRYIPLDQIKEWSVN